MQFLDVKSITWEIGCIGIWDKEYFPNILKSYICYRMVKLKDSKGWMSEQSATHDPPVCDPGGEDRGHTKTPTAGDWAYPTLSHPTPPPVR